MARVVSFGEVMTRFRVPGNRRVVQALPGTVDVSFAGAEANIAAGVALLGGSALFVTALPRNPIADSCITYLKGIGVDTSSIVRTDAGRIGTYYIEVGANQRASNVVYDRDYSAVALADTSSYDWATFFNGADWFHTTGITPALSKKAAEAALDAARAAKEHGLTVSCDLNYRGKLWRWDNKGAPKDLARATMEKILPFVDVVIANEADADDVLGIRAGESRVEHGTLDIARYPDVARQIVERFPNVKRVAITLRESVSASHNRWGAMLYEASTGDAVFAPMRDGEYSANEITHIVDRVGAGDSFGAALIFASCDPELKGEPARELSFAVAASTLCHSIEGDINYVTRAEIENLAAGDASGRVVR